MVQEGSLKRRLLAVNGCGWVKGEETEVKKQKMKASNVLSSCKN